MENYKPVFHITGEKGWINDPNGIIKFRGKHHVFYQHHPYSCVWGPMHWGHVISDDLKKWEYLPYALVPGDEFDKDGCFSGTSIVINDTLYIMYTGFINHENPEKIRQIQCLAKSSDGIHFTKLGAVITEKELPDAYKTCDFRDPKLVYKNDEYLCFVAAKKKSGGGSILLFKSKDLQHWSFVNDVLTHNSEGGMIECVDYHEDLGLLIYSEQDFPKDNPHCLNIHSCEYELGKLNDEGKFIPNKEKTLLDYGFDFYAPQVMNKDHYLIAWMDMWDRNNPSDKYGFAGMLTVPRKVTIEKGKLVQTPLIYGDLDCIVGFENVYYGHLSVGTLHLSLTDLKALSIDLRMGKDEVTKFYLKGDEFFFDRSKSGEEIKGVETDELSLNGIRKMPYDKRKEDNIYIILDKYSIEIFVNGISMSNVVYPKENSNAFEIKLTASKAKLSIYK
ncbi:MAG: GH32 C-terminal domain-containing protein [Bacilli bacterium]|nr:GH32 C-terminal domain-containing protein [Bacilli bacterium]